MSPAVERAGALALLVVIVGVVAIAAGTPLWRLYDDQAAEIERNRELVQRFGAVAAGLGPLEQELRVVEAGADTSRYTLRGPSPALAAAQLQERVRTVVERHGGTMTSAQVVDTRGEGYFQEVAINVRLSADVPVLQRVLHSLESSVPWLQIEDLVVVARRPRRARRAALDAPAAPILLDVRFRVAGYMPRELSP